MRRDNRAPRPDWRRRVEHLSFDFHTFDGQPYWVEDACYRFDAAEIDRIEDAGNALHALCLEAVDRICRRGEFDRVGLDRRSAELAEVSWRRGDKALLGRMDLAYDGAGADQFNRIHEALVERWPQVASRGERVHFAGALESDEDRGTVEYLRRTCEEAGFDTDLLDIAQVGLLLGEFVDAQDRPIRQLAKLYPWEWLLAEEFGAAIAAAPTRWIEPAWRQVLSNKRVLPLLWELFPDHPNLLPASTDPSRVPGPVVRKPQFGREGEGVSLHASADALLAEPGVVFQQRAPLFHSEAGHTLVGLWMVGDEAVGMGLREDDDAVTRNTSRFVPHCFD